MTTPSPAPSLYPNPESYIQRNTLLARLLLLLAAALLMLPWLGQRDLWFPDEPDVAEPAMTMYVTGDWVTPRHNDEPWADYPPLTYWLGTISAHIFGAPSPGALRLPVALMALALLCLVSFAPCAASDPRGAHRVYAAIVLATCPLFVLQSINYHPDMAFALLQAAGLFLYGSSATVMEPRSRVVRKACAFACFGAAVLAKGPLGLLLPGLILTVWHLSFRAYRDVLLLGAYTPIALAVCLPWYFAFAQATGAEHVWTELYLQNFARFVDGNRGHEKPWYYYLVGIWAQMAPWAFLLPTAVAEAIRQRWHEPFTRLLVLWLSISFIFLSIATTKREVYLLPAYPAAVLLIGQHVVNLFHRVPPPLLVWGRRAFGGLSAVMGLAILALAAWPSWVLSLTHDERFAEVIDDLRLSSAIAGGLFCAIAVLMLYRARMGFKPQVVLLSALALWMNYLIMHSVFFPRINQERSYVPAIAYARALSPERPLLYYAPGVLIKRCGFRTVDPLFMALPTYTDPEQFAKALVSGVNTGIVDTRQLPKIQAYLEGQPSLTFQPFLLSQVAYTIIHHAGPEGSR